MTDDDFLAECNRVIKSGISQTALAARAGMDQGHLSKVLSGKKRLTAKARRKIAPALRELDSSLEASDAVSRLSQRLLAVPADMRESIGGVLLAALDALLKFPQEAKGSGKSGGSEPL